MGKKGKKADSKARSGKAKRSPPGAASPLWWVTREADAIVDLGKGGAFRSDKAVRGVRPTRQDASLSPDLPAGPDELAARLAGLSTLLQREIGRSDPGEGLTQARLSALAMLVLGGPRTLGALAAAEHVRPPTMTRMVTAMESEGLVVRERSAADGRSVIVRATDAGERVVAVARTRQLAPLTDALAALEGRERWLLDDATEILGRVLRSRRIVDERMDDGSSE